MYEQSENTSLNKNSLTDISKTHLANSETADLFQSFTQAPDLF